jgi:hypothetical protein
LRDEQSKPSARFFAEKGEIDQIAREGVRLFFGMVREIVIVRDPRDVLCSAAAFWRLPHTEAFEMLQTTLPRLEEIYRQSDSDSFFIRYEDLIRKPVETWNDTYRFIGIEPRALDISEETSTLFGKHGTSGSPDQSIGRWRQDLTPDEIRQCNFTFQSFMRQFGYNHDGIIEDWRSDPDNDESTEIVETIAPVFSVTVVPEQRRTEPADLPFASYLEIKAKDAAALQDLLVKFESLGENCEFGLVQRHCGAEPLGLLRFSSSPLSVLITALETEFEGLGHPDRLSVELSTDRREYMVRDEQFGFLYHAWVLAGEMPPAEIHEREVKQLPTLTRKMIHDLTVGEKFLFIMA